MLLNLRTASARAKHIFRAALPLPAAYAALLMLSAPGERFNRRRNVRGSQQAGRHDRWLTSLSLYLRRLRHHRSILTRLLSAV